VVAIFISLYQDGLGFHSEVRWYKEEPKANECGGKGVSGNQKNELLVANRESFLSLSKLPFYSDAVSYSESLSASKTDLRQYRACSKSPYRNTFVPRYLALPSSSTHHHTQPLLWLPPTPLSPHPPQSPLNPTNPPLGRRLRRVQTKHIPRLQNIRITILLIDLFTPTLPLRLTNSVDPVFDFHDDAAILLRYARPGGVVEEASG
jgi:hypothetical protein